MVAQRTNSDQFNEAHVLAKRIEELTKERDDLTKRREDDQTSLLNSHSCKLINIDKQLDLLIDRTKDLPKIFENFNTRLSAQERWKILMTGYAAAFGIMGAFLGWVTNLIIRR
jgi:malate synthase